MACCMTVKSRDQAKLYDATHTRSIHMGPIATLTNPDFLPAAKTAEE